VDAAVVAIIIARMEDPERPLSPRVAAEQTAFLHQLLICANTRPDEEETTR
jgi:hypothetical protein